MFILRFHNLWQQVVSECFQKPSSIISFDAIFFNMPIDFTSTLNIFWKAQSEEYQKQAHFFFTYVRSAVGEMKNAFPCHYRSILYAVIELSTIEEKK